MDAWFAIGSAFLLLHSVVLLHIRHLPRSGNHIAMLATTHTPSICLEKKAACAGAVPAW